MNTGHMDTVRQDNATGQISTVERLNALYADYQTALDAAATAQKDIVVILRLHFHEQGTLPPQEMQAAANDLWYEAAVKKAELEQFFNQVTQYG